MMLILTGQEVVDKWYSEQAKFNYGKPEGAKGQLTSLR